MKTAFAGLLLFLTAVALPLAASVGSNDVAPLFVAVNEELETIDMADYLDGTPLVFIYGSAT